MKTLLGKKQMNPRILTSWTSQQHVAVLQQQKTGLEIAWRSSYEQIIHENAHFRYFPYQKGRPLIGPPIIHFKVGYEIQACVPLVECF